MLAFTAVLLTHGQTPCNGLNASFTWASSAATGNPVQFSNGTTGTGQQTTWQWNFGDGTTSNVAQPLHEFPGPGTYTVCLVAISIYISNAGVATTCVDDICATVTVPGVNNCSWLNASFNWGAGANGVEFTYQPPTPSAQYAYLWSFGDGTTASTQNVFHSYAAAGTYEVCLTVIAYSTNGSAPCTATSCQAVTWSGGESEECDPSFALEIESEPSNAGFSLTASTNIPNDGITWTFANGLVLSGPTISVGLGSVLNIELCVTAWYQPANSTETCTTTVCGLLSELGFAVSVAEVPVAEVSAWPNPATDALFLRIDGGAAQASVMIHGPDGRLEREQTVNADQSCIDLNGLAPGLKSVSVSVGGKTERFKIVKE